MTPSLTEPDDLLRVWKVLADPNRRAMLDLLRKKPMTTGELASHFDFTRFAAMKHLDLLVEANLVLVRRQGKERWNAVNPVPLQQIYHRWLKPFEADTVEALHRLKGLAEQGVSMPTATLLSSYTLNLQIEINAKRPVIWKAMTKEINKWWPGSFYSSEATKAFVMEPHVGGRVFEDWGNGAGGEWGRLIVFQPHEKLIWAGNHFGGSGKNWGNFFVTIQLKDHGKGVMLEFEDSGFGMLDAGMKSSLESGWKELYGTHLKDYVEKKNK